MAKEKKSDLPSGDMAGLMQYLVRPVSDLEDKINGVKKQFDERIHYNLDRVDKLIEAVKGHDLKLDALVREPRKLENRVGVLEGKAKQAEPLAKGLMDCEKRVSMLEQQNAVLYDMNNDVKELKKNYLNLKKEVMDSSADHEKRLNALHDDCDENRRGLQDFRNESLKRCDLENEAAEEVYADQAKRFSLQEKELRSVLAKVSDFNHKVEQMARNAADSLRVSYEELHFKNEELRKDSDSKHEKLLKELERLSFLAEKDEHRDNADAKRLQILEMQVENLELALKELKLKK